MFRSAATLSMPVFLRRAGLVTMACAAMTLTACGGGSRAKDYHPDRIVSFGDENSAFESIVLPTGNAAGNKTLQSLTYTVNAVLSTVTTVCVDNATPAACSSDSGGSFPSTPTSVNAYILDPVAPDTVELPSTVTVIEKGVDTGTSGALQRTMQRGYSCNAANIWIQYVAAAFGKGYPNSCGRNTGAVSYAANGADVAAIAAQVAAHRGELTKGVLVTLLGGQNDIMYIYDQVKNHGMDDATAKSYLEGKAAELAGVVDAIVDTGARVILALPPDMGQSPQAIEDGKTVLLASLTKIFNDSLYLDHVNSSQSGRTVAGVDPQIFMAVHSTSYNYTTPACDTTLTVPYPNEVSPAKPAVVYCTTDRLVSGASASTYIWADKTHLSPLGHSMIGSTAYNRAANQF